MIAFPETLRLRPRPVASMLNGQAGLRFKALRVQRSCYKIYESISSNAVQRTLFGIRAEHYLPWLFEPLFVPCVNGVRTAIATVLLSDELRIRELMNQSKDASIEALSLAAPILRLKGMQHLDVSPMERLKALELLAAQDRALMLEGSLIQHAMWQAPEEASALGRAKLGHIEIVLHHLFREIEGTSTAMRASESLFRFLDLQKKFAHYLLWNRVYPAPCTNRFLIEARHFGSESHANTSPTPGVAYGEFGQHFLNGLRKECREISALSEGMHRLQTVVSQTDTRLANLTRDLEKLHDA